MSYYELMASDSYGRYNRKLMKLAGLNTAVYWSEILDIVIHVVKKKKFDENGFFKIDRKYIEDRTGLKIEDQLDCDAILENLKVLEHAPGETSKIKVMLSTMEQLIISDSNEISEISIKKTKLTKSQKAENKKNAVVLTMKKLIKEKDVDLRLKYEAWVDSVYASGKGFLTKEKIEIFENGINAFSSDKQVKLLILQQAIITGYTNPEWVIHAYETSTISNSKSNKSASTLGTQKVSTAVDTKKSF